MFGSYSHMKHCYYASKKTPKRHKIPGPWNAQKGPFQDHETAKVCYFKAPENSKKFLPYFRPLKTHKKVFFGHWKSQKVWEILYGGLGELCGIYKCIVAGECQVLEKFELGTCVIIWVPLDDVKYITLKIKKQKFKCIVQCTPKQFLTIASVIYNQSLREGNH